MLCRSCSSTQGTIFSARESDHDKSESLKQNLPFSCTIGNEFSARDVCVLPCCNMRHRYIDENHKFAVHAKWFDQIKKNPMGIRGTPLCDLPRKWHHFWFETAGTETVPQGDQHRARIHHPKTTAHGCWAGHFQRLSSQIFG